MKRQLNGTNNSFGNESRLYCRDLIFCDGIENSSRFESRRWLDSPVFLRLEFFILKVGFNRVLHIDQVARSAEATEAKADHPRRAMRAHH
ncbi:MAG: hypothetical protein JSW26_01595 [Desulfobacterales bacterium]|nr:MAG: hypothetical protein JSW26_01595 [Desulfobacterales bacterium]